MVWIMRPGENRAQGSVWCRFKICQCQNVNMHVLVIPPSQNQNKTTTCDDASVLGHGPAGGLTPKRTSPTPSIVTEGCPVCRMAPIFGLASRAEISSCRGIAAPWGSDIGLLRRARAAL